MMASRLFGIAFFVLLGTVITLDRYSAAGLQIARDECRREGILRIFDRELWQMLVKDPGERRRFTRSSRDVRRDERFYRTIRQIRLDGKLVAELNVLRFSPVSVSSKIFGQPSSVYVCAWDERRPQYLAVEPLF